MSAKIYTKTGDNGTSKAIRGKRLPKNALLFEVLGNLDELNATLGLALLTKTTLKDSLSVVQSDLFKIGAIVAGNKILPKDIKWLTSRVNEIEAQIDFIDAKNSRLANFILPGGTNQAAFLHLSRTVCRRAERSFTSLYRTKKLKNSDIILTYLNRLSDYLFVLARYNNNKGKADIIWVPND